VGTARRGALRSIPLDLHFAHLIFDDPVNSLDYRRIGEVSSRIALLAADRQVIVFTHNLWLAVELLAKFESNRERCTYYRVSDEGGKGLITKGVHPRWDTVKKTKAKINSAIQEAEGLQGEQREVFVERTYSLMRSWCEVLLRRSSSPVSLDASPPTFP
jgi:wobble nucleotide-excising tRNase